MAFPCFLWAAGPTGDEPLAGLEPLAGVVPLAGLGSVAGVVPLAGLGPLAGVAPLAGLGSVAGVVPLVKARPSTSFGVLLLNVLYCCDGDGVSDPLL